MISTYYKNQWFVLLVTVGVFLASAVLFLSLAKAADEAQIQAAIQDLSSVTGQNITSEEQAKDLCNQEQYLDICADIGKRHELYTPDEAEQVDAFLNEIKGQVLADIKACQDEECLIKVASQLAQKVQASNPTLATNLKLTTAIVNQKNTVVQAAKEVGVNFRDCEAMNPDTAPVDLLRKCAKLAKDARVQRYIPEEKRVLAQQFEDSATLKLREALAAGTYQCGDGTLEGCGNFCLNPDAATRAAGIPAVCTQIASEIFGQEGAKQLELAHQQVGQVKDYYSKKFILTLPNGKELVGEGQIRNACDQAFSNRNLEIARACGNFAVKNGFVSQAKVDRGLKLLESFVQKGQKVGFNKCIADPVACRDFIPEDDRNRFDAGSQIFALMKSEIGFDPSQCERGAMDQVISTKCFEGSKRALAKIESLGLATQSEEAKFIVEDIKRHVAEGESLTQRKDQFREVFDQQGGPGGCRSEAECFTYCSDPANGPECISFGAKQEISGFRGKEAIQKFQEYNQNLQRPGLTPNGYNGQFPQFPGQGPYPGFQPGDVPPGQFPGFTQPGPGFSPPPGTGGFYPGQSPVEPSPECFAAIQSGDFAKAKIICVSSVPVEPSYRTPPICPLSPYVECPADQYRESFRNRDGCWVDGPCKLAPTYSPGPAFTPSGDPVLECKRVGGVWDDNVKSCRFPDPLYSPEPTPVYSPSSGQREQIWNNNGLRSYIRSDADPARIEQLKTACVKVSGSANIWLPGAGDPSSKDFGMPDPIKCQKAAACSAGQYFDGASCTGTSYTTGPSPISTYTPYPTSTGVSGMYSCFYPNATKNGSPTGYTVWCEKDYFNCHEGSKTGPSISLNGLSLGAPSSCESGYQGQSCNNNNFCDSNETYTSCPSDCGGATYSPYPTYSPPPGTGSCPSGYHYHPESGGFCINDQENYGGTCYDASGANRITCPAQPTYSPSPTYSQAPGTSYTPYPTCPSGQWWDPAISACKSTTPYDTAAPIPSCPSGQWWDYATNSCKSSTYTYTPAPTCPPDQWWDYATSTCKTTSSSGFCGNGYCESYETSSSCPSDCGGGTTYTPYPTTEYSPTPYPTTEYTPPPPSESPSPTSGLYPHYIIAHCQQLGRTWNGKTCEANGLLARLFESSGMASIFRLFYIIP